MVRPEELAVSEAPQDLAVEDSGTAVVRAYLVSLAFRFRHVTEGAPEGFGEFEAGAGVRTPGAIVLHMTGLLRWTRDAFEPGTNERLEPLPFPAECARFLDAVAELDRTLAEGRTIASDRTFGQLWRGHLTDAMTHVGQLATLRRLAGGPVDRVRYWQADMPAVSATER